MDLAGKPHKRLSTPNLPTNLCAQIILHYFAAPVLAIVFSFGYPVFIGVRNDPLHIFAFFCAHLVPAIVIGTFIVPRMLNPLVPVKRREEGKRAYAPQASLRPIHHHIQCNVVRAPGSNDYVGSVRNQRYPRLRGHRGCVG